MPATLSPAAEALWDALKLKDYAIARQIIIEHPAEDLYNSMHPTLGTLISVCCISKIIPADKLDFIKFIAPHVNLQQGTPKKSNVRGIILLGSEDIFKLFESKIDILFNNGELSYAYAKQTFKDPNYVVTKLHQLTIQHSEIIIRKAMSTDNTILLDQLENMGIDPSKPLRDGTRPARLAVKGSKTGQWFVAQLERELVAHTQEMSKSPNAFELWRSEEMALATLTAEHNKKQAALYAEAADALTAEIATLGL